MEKEEENKPENYRLKKIKENKRTEKVKREDGINSTEERNGEIDGKKLSEFKVTITGEKKSEVERLDREGKEEEEVEEGDKRGWKLGQGGIRRKK